MVNYFQSFVIGSSILITSHYFLSLYFFSRNNPINYNVILYSIVAPVYFGLMSVIIRYLLIQGWSEPTVFIGIFLLSGTLVNILVRISDGYDLEGSEWLIYYQSTYIRHALSYIIIYFLMHIFNGIV